MAVFNFQKPDKVIMIDSSEFEGKFEFRPLEPGYGLTIGNALRRVLLSSLEGFAFTSVRLDNIDHEFSSLPGIVEDVTEMVRIAGGHSVAEFESSPKMYTNITVSYTHLTLPTKRIV